MIVSPCEIEFWLMLCDLRFRTGLFSIMMPGRRHQARHQIRLKTGKIEEFLGQNQKFGLL
jgi:hypothetical protein